MKIAQIKNDLLNWRKLSVQKIAKYLGFIVGSAVLLCLLIFVFFPDPFINNLLKDQITKAFTEAYPRDSIKFGDLHYNVWQNRLGCDSISMKTGDSTLSCSAASIYVGGINWIKILWNKDFTLNDLTSSVIDAQEITVKFKKSQIGLRIGMLHISVPDSQMMTDSIKYYSLLNDEQFFAKSQFRQTRFRFDIPKIKILGLDYPGLIKGNIYNARSININEIFADILVNIDKPFDKNSTNPQMPNEALSLMKEIVKVDSLKIINGRLKYCERYAIGATPGVITFKKVNVSAFGITNSKVDPDTTIIVAEGVFMNSAKMKLLMKIPLASKDFSLKYSGSLSTMDATELNSFIEPSEHQRIKSGIIQSANFNINVISGKANGSLRVNYKDLSIALINKETGSDKGLFNQVASFFGKVFVVRSKNLPDEKGLIEIGEIKYTRHPDDYFIQYLWFSLRNGIAVVVGFPPT
jgi:hypothetical protein